MVKVPHPVSKENKAVGHKIIDRKNKLRISLPQQINTIVIKFRDANSFLLSCIHFSPEDMTPINIFFQLITCINLCIFTHLFCVCPIFPRGHYNFCLFSEFLNA